MCIIKSEIFLNIQGDSGGPLVSNGVLVGISSFTEPCAIGKPDVYARVFSHLDFIKSGMINLNPQICCSTL